jgi:NAD(P)-dependent dehydrogenase (short-subunit alcohol dehydrogenase family)
MRDIAAQAGRIDVLVHAAGIEISHFVADKKPSEFDLVFDVKSDGWFNLLSNVSNMPVGAAVVFSSVAGRFGNFLNGETLHAIDKHMNGQIRQAGSWNSLRVLQLGCTRPRCL